MKKLALIFLSILVALAMVLPTTVVLADSEKESKPQLAARAALMIRAPSIAEVGQPVTITVLGRFSHQPIGGAEVYALKTDRMAITADKKKYTTSEAEYIALLDEEGSFLGETNAKGSITCKFADSGRFMLVAFKAGHIPGFSRITITLSSTRGLHLKSPSSIETGKPVTLAVVERSSHEPAAKAAVYAKKIGAISLPKPTAASIFSTIIGVVKRPIPLPSTDNRVDKGKAPKIDDEVQNAEDFKKNGILLGYTDEKGELVYTFSEPGHYVLAALKEEHAPGFARITITPIIQKALDIKAPDRAEVGKPVTIGVFERTTHRPVPKAAVYALRIGDLLSAVPAEKPTTLVNTPAPIILEAEAAVDADSVKAKGIFLGETDDKGQVTATFDKTGRHVLAAIKDGCQPGFARMSIVPARQKALGIKASDRAEIGKPVTISTFERNAYQPVPKAALYALRIGEPDRPILSPFESMLKAEAASPAEAEKHAAEVKVKGIFLGYTNENAHLVYTFDKQGHYLLVAIKDGYLPGFARTSIVPKILLPHKANVVPQSTPRNAPK